MEYFEENLIEKSPIQRVALTFQWIFSIFGINLPPIFNRYSNFIYLICIIYGLHLMFLMALVIWMVCGNNVIIDRIVDGYDLDSLTNYLSRTQNIAVAFVQLTIQVVAIVKRKCLTMIIQRMAQLEQGILLYYRDYQCLQEDMQFEKVRERNRTFPRRLLITFGGFLLIFSVLFSYVNFYLVADISSTIETMLTLFCVLLIQLIFIEYCIIIRIIQEFITALQQSLLQLKYELGKSVRRNLPDDKAIFRSKLMTNQFLLNRVWYLSQDIEEYFSWPLLILFLYNGIAITHTINWSYVTSFDYNGRKDRGGIFRLYYIILLFTNMLAPCWLNQSCIDKYNKFGSILHNIKASNTFNLVFNASLREYSLQLMHQKLLFTCNGFFDINLKYFGLMTLSIITFVAILIQFKLQKEMEKSYLRL